MKNPTTLIRSRECVSVVAALFLRGRASTVCALCPLLGLFAIAEWISLAVAVLLVVLC